MQTSIELKIDTGAGLYPSIASIGIVPDNWQPILAIAFAASPLDNFDTQLATDAIVNLTAAIDSLQNQRASYAALADVDRANRSIVLRFLTNWQRFRQLVKNREFSSILKLWRQQFSTLATNPLPLPIISAPQPPKKFTP